MLPSVTLILHFLQVPWPPQVESIATPFHDPASHGGFVEYERLVYRSLAS